jgi:hypothetical protein
MAKLSYVQVEVIQLCHIDLAAWCASPWYSALHVLMIRLVTFGLAQSVAGIVCNIDPLSVGNVGSRCIANLLWFEHWKGSVELSHWLDTSIVVCWMWIASAVLSIVVGLACYDPPHIVFWGWWLFRSWILLQSLVIWKLSYTAEPEWMKQNHLQYRGVQWSEDLGCWPQV